RTAAACASRGPPPTVPPTTAGLLGPFLSGSRRAAAAGRPARTVESMEETRTTPREEARIPNPTPAGPAAEPGLSDPAFEAARRRRRYERRRAAGRNLPPFQRAPFRSADRGRARSRTWRAAAAGSAIFAVPRTRAPASAPGPCRPDRS